MIDCGDSRREWWAGILCIAMECSRITGPKPEAGHRGRGDAKLNDQRRSTGGILGGMHGALGAGVI